MLGVFGTVPALDDNFCKGFCSSKNLSKSLLQKISDYYQINKGEFDRYKIKTIDFGTGMETDRYYTKAKLIGLIRPHQRSRKITPKVSNRLAMRKIEGLGIAVKCWF
jgi:hypothetical protein